MRTSNTCVDEPNYVVRRFAVGGALLVAAVATVAAADGLLAGFGGVPASASEARPATAGSTVHVAAAGESLWTIAEQHRGDIAHGRYVDALIELNGGAAIQAGQAVRLP